MRNQQVIEAMTALETAIAITENAQREEHRTGPWASRCAAEIEPTRWTRDIEAAIGSLDETEALRVQFDEKALTFVSSLLSFAHYRSQVFEAYSPLCDAIRAVVALLDEPKAVEQRDRPGLQALVLRAIEVHHKERADGPTPIDALDDRTHAYGVLVTAFKAFVPTLKSAAAGSRYTTDLVVQGRKYKPVLSSTVDLRSMWMVPFVDCQNSKHPANTRLVAAHAAAELAQKKARELVKKLKSEQNGQVNERQHADRMIAMMHGQTYCSGNVAEQVVAQNERRLAYETARQQVVVAISELEECYGALKSALVEATAETDSFFESDIKNQRIVTIDCKDSIRVAMNNCLAADYYLRQLGREIDAFNNHDARDMSLGNGRAALEAAYTAAVSSYRPLKSSLREDAKD